MLLISPRFIVLSREELTVIHMIHYLYGEKMTNNYLQLTSLVIMQVKRSIIIKPEINNHGNWTEWSAIWSEIIRLILKSHVFDLKSQVWFQTKIAQHKVQLPFYYSHFEIAEFSQYQYLFEQVAVLLRSRNKKAFKSHFVPETEMMQYRAKIGAS